MMAAWLEADAAEEESGDEDGQIGEGGAEVRLHEDQDHGDADQGEGLADVLPGELPGRRGARSSGRRR